MIERKLSKTQVRIFSALAQQRAELQKAFQEVVEAEGEQIEMLRKQFDLPEGEYRLQQEPSSGEVKLVMVPKEKKEPEKSKEKEGGKKEGGE